MGVSKLLLKFYMITDIQLLLLVSGILFQIRRDLITGILFPGRENIIILILLRMEFAKELMDMLLILQQILPSTGWIKGIRTNLFSWFTSKKRRIATGCRKKNIIIFSTALHSRFLQIILMITKQEPVLLMSRKWKLLHTCILGTI